MEAKDLIKVKQWVSDTQVRIDTVYFREEKELRFAFPKCVIAIGEKAIRVVTFDPKKEKRYPIRGMEATELVNLLLTNL